MLLPCRVSRSGCVVGRGERERARSRGLRTLHIWVLNSGQRPASARTSWRGHHGLLMAWAGVADSRSQSGARCSKKHHHAPFRLYATPAHAIRDVLHASNYLTITEGPGRFGSIVRPPGGHVDGHASPLISLQHSQGLQPLTAVRTVSALGRFTELGWLRDASSAPASSPPHSAHAAPLLCADGCMGETAGEREHWCYKRHARGT